MDHTIALIRKSHAGNRTARAQLVEENTGLVWCIVKRYFNRGVEAEDLFQIGTIRGAETSELHGAAACDQMADNIPVIKTKNRIFI